jgi:uncharacterized membrane protein YgcG
MRLARRLASLLVCWLVAFPFLQGRAEEFPRGTSKRIHPQALEILKRMSTTLSEAKAFAFRSRSVIEVPMRTGQFITLFSPADVALKRPDKLRARSIQQQKLLLPRRPGIMARVTYRGGSASWGGGSGSATGWRGGTASWGGGSGSFHGAFGRSGSWRR